MVHSLYEGVTGYYVQIKKHFFSVYHCLTNILDPDEILHFAAFHLHCFGENSGSVVECFARDQGGAGSSLTSATVLCPWARHIYPCLVLVQPRKTPPDITEKLLTVTNN